MKFERTKNAKRNILWGLINKVCVLVLPFASRTVLIYVLGSEYLGLSSLFTSILTVLNLSELGVGSAIVFSMYKPIAENDENTICALLSLYKKIYRIIGLVVLILGIALVPFLDKLIKSDLPSDVNLYILYAIYLINTCITYWLFAYKNCLLHAFQRDDIGSKINTCTTVLLHVLQISLLVITKNYYFYICVMPLISFLNNIVNVFFANKLFPTLRCRGLVQKNVKNDISKRILGLSIIKVAAVSRNALDSIILSAFLGLNIVAAYNNYYYILSSLAGVLTIFTSAISSIVGNTVATETKEKNYSDMRFLNYMYLLLSGWCTVCMVNIYQPFMKIWVGESLMFNDIIMVLFSTYFYLSRIGDIQAQYFDAAGLWWNGKFRGLIEAIANLSLNLLLGYYYGVLGIVLATIISIILINIPLSIYYTFKYYYQFSPAKFIGEQVLLVFIVGLSCFVSYFVTNLIPFGEGIIMSILCILLRFVMSSLIFAIIAFLMSIRSGYLKRIYSFIKRK